VGLVLTKLGVPRACSLDCLTSFFSSTTGFIEGFFSTATTFGAKTVGVFVVNADVEGFGPFGPKDLSATSFMFNYDKDLQTILQEVPLSSFTPSFLPAGFAIVINVCLKI
jgi:hypothetical protein